MGLLSFSAAKGDESDFFLVSRDGMLDKSGLPARFISKMGECMTGPDAWLCAMSRFEGKPSRVPVLGFDRPLSFE